MAHCSASYTPCSEPSCHGVAAGEQHRAQHLVLRLLYVFAFVLRHVDPCRVTGASVCTSRRTARSSSSSIRRQVFASTHVPPPRDFRALVIYIITAASLSPLFLSLLRLAPVGRAVPVAAAGSAGLLLAPPVSTVLAPLAGKRTPTSALALDFHRSAVV